MIMEHKQQQISDAKSVAKILHTILMAEDECSREREHVWVIGLNNQNIVQYVELVSLGSADRSFCIPRDIYRMACIKGSIRIIMGHNHPGGSLEPSAQDYSVTKGIKEAGTMLGIELLDSIIITQDGKSYSVLNNC